MQTGRRRWGRPTRVRSPYQGTGAAMHSRSARSARYPGARNVRDSETYSRRRPGTSPGRPSASGCCYPSKFGGRRGLDLPHQILERLFCVRFSGMAARDVPHCTSVPGLPFHVRPPVVGAGVDWA